MFAVIKTGGKQYRVEQGDMIEIEKLDIEAGNKVTFDEVLLVENNGEMLIGTPFVDKAQVKAVVLESFKDQKVIVFKKKRRKQYKKKTGHRQQLLRVKIEEILTGGKAISKEKPAEKPTPKVEPEKKKAETEKPQKTPVEKPVKKAEAPKTKDKVKAETADKLKPKAPAKKKAEKKTSAKPKKGQ